ncbi:myocilin opposite strand protein [Cavia porcellus]|uniref:myocilin opposite strand protein n=1 Tax=Cavia porcellus TaxID=10141 RepID=UPI002FDF4758
MQTMERRSAVNHTINFPYQDLASEVTRRRDAMATREEMITKKNNDARERVYHSDTETEASPRKTDLMVPPPPPPSPAEESTIC